MSRATGVSDVIAEVEQAKLRQARDDARSQPLTTAEIAGGLRRLMDGKCWWIEQFSNGSKRRPAHEVDARRRELAVLVQAYDRIVATGDQNAAQPP